MKCDDCLNGRPVISENGMHHVCGLSDRASTKCITGENDRYISIRRLLGVEEVEVAHE